MPEKETLEESRKAKREGMAPATQAGPFVKEEIEHVREGKHGARSTKQAIAIGLSKARKAGVRLQRRKGIRVPRKGKGVRTKGPAGRRAAAKKAARTRARS